MPAPQRRAAYLGDVGTAVLTELAENPAAARTAIGASAGSAREVRADDTGDYATLSAAVTAIGSAQAEIVIASPVTLTGNVTVPAGVRVTVARGGSIALGGHTLTFNGRLLADRAQVFTGSGAVVLGAGSADAAFPEWWGARPDGTVDSGPAITKAVAAVKAAGGVVDLAPGTYLISTTIDATMIQPNQSFHVTPKAVTIRGAGSRRTYLTGGEAGYGFIELTGSNYIQLTGFTCQTSGGTKQYGILGGRTTGDGSSGVHYLTDVHVYGAFSLAAIFMLSSEINTYDKVHVYSTAGKPMVLAKDVGGWAVTTKYAPLTATVPMGGGNGVNRLLGCSLMTSSASATDYVLVIEYAQTMLVENLYTYAHNATAHVWVRKRSHDITFVNMHQEFLNTEPWGVVYGADGDVVTPQFNNQTFIGCRMYGIHAEDGTKLTNLLFRGVFRGTGAKSHILDVDTGIDMSVHAVSTADVPDVAGISAANLKYRVRTAGGHNDFGRAPVANITVPDASLEMPGTRSQAETLTNKRINPRTFQTATATTTSVNFDTTDVHIVTAQAATLTLNVSGTPASGQQMVIRIKDNGSSQTLTWAANFRGVGVALPAATTAGKTMYVTCRYNAADAKVDVIAVATEA